MEGIGLPLLLLPHRLELGLRLNPLGLLLLEQHAQLILLAHVLLGDALELDGELGAELNLPLELQVLRLGALQLNAQLG